MLSYIALGGNLPHPILGPPPAVFYPALDILCKRSGGRMVGRSPWYSSKAWPPSAQPRYVNGVAVFEGAPEPAALLSLLHEIEAYFGRRRRRANEARIIDLDLLAVDGRTAGPDAAGAGPILPHPRMAERAFVLVPLRDVAPGWRHPVLGETVEALIARLGPADDVRPL